MRPRPRPKLSLTPFPPFFELKVAYHKAVTSQTGLLRAQGRVLTMGLRAAFAEATLTDANGRLHASAASTLLVIDG